MIFMDFSGFRRAGSRRTRLEEQRLFGPSATSRDGEARPGQWSGSESRDLPDGAGKPPGSGAGEVTDEMFDDLAIIDNLDRDDLDE